jgi:hypothetical protein
MSYVEIFLLLNFTALCGILVVLWQIRDHVVKPPLKEVVKKTEAKEEAKQDSSASAGH